MSRLFLGYQRNVTILKYIIIFIWLIILLKIFDIQIINSSNLIRKSSITSISTLGSRGNILDRNNAILATTIPKYDFSATTILNLDSTKSPEEAMKETYDVTEISQLFADNFYIY